MEESNTLSNQIIPDGRIQEGSIFTNTKIIVPLDIRWEPKEDITAFELAQCLQYINRTVMPWEISPEMSFMRHFRITDRNIELNTKQ